MKPKFFDKTMLRYILVGILNTIVGCGIMFLLYNFAGCSYWVSSAANHVVGGTVGFLLSKYYTFKSKAWSWGQMVRYVINVAACYFIAYGVAKPLVQRLLTGQLPELQENIAMLAGMCIYIGLNYLGQRFFAFRAED